MILFNTNWVFLIEAGRSFAHREDLAFFESQKFITVSCTLGVSNAQFVCGKAEDIIVDVFKNMPRKTKIIGIMDPPRAGLRKSPEHIVNIS